MKVIVNKKEAYCLTCSGGGHAVISFDGAVVCSNCFSSDLISGTTGKEFLAVFGVTTKTFQVNQYCPELPDRRLQDRIWPISKERRKRNDKKTLQRNI